MAASPYPVARFRFGGFTIDPGAGELSSTAVKLQDHPFQWLLALLRL